MDRFGFAFTQDLLCVSVAVVATTLLLVNMSYLYADKVEDERLRWLGDEATRACNGLLDYGEVLRDGKRGLFDREKLDGAGLAGILAHLGIHVGFNLTITAISDPGGGVLYAWSWTTGVPSPDRAACTTSAALQIDEEKIVPVRVVATVWRV